MDVSEFEWDDANREKCETHGVGVGVIEGLVIGGTLLIAPDPFVAEVRLRAIRRAQNHAAYSWYLQFACEAVSGSSDGLARYMHQKELERYEKEIPQF